MFSVRLFQAKMKQRGAAVVPDKPGKDLNKALADMRRRKATLEERGAGGGVSGRGHRKRTRGF